MERNELFRRHDRYRGNILKGGIFTREGIAFWILIAIAVSGDYYLGVLRFILGYTGFLTGAMNTPITPVTDIMSLVTLTVVFLKLYRNGIALFSALAVSIATVIAALSSFEFLWDFFLLAGNSYISWLGFTGPEWHYVFAFNSLTALWLIGIRYWRITWWSFLLMLSYPLSFVLWYMIGYPQPWTSHAIDSAFLWNSSVKVLSFLGLLAPVLGFRTSQPASGEFH